MSCFSVILSCIWKVVLHRRIGQQVGAQGNYERHPRRGDNRSGIRRD
jgi:hypothetical protein